MLLFLKLCVACLWTGPYVKDVAAGSCAGDSGKLCSFCMVLMRNLSCDMSLACSVWEHAQNTEVGMYNSIFHCLPWFSFLM